MPARATVGFKWIEGISVGMEGECTNPLRPPHAPPAFRHFPRRHSVTGRTFFFLLFTPPPPPSLEHSILRLLSYGAQFFYKKEGH
jgi:hypothetical protein